MGGLALLFYLAQNSTIINLVKVAVPREGGHICQVSSQWERFRFFSTNDPSGL